MADVETAFKLIESLKDQFYIFSICALNFMAK